MILIKQAAHQKVAEKEMNDHPVALTDWARSKYFAAKSYLYLYHLILTYFDQKNFSMC